MLVIQLFLLSISGFIGIILNWLFILAIQRKNYHYQHTQKVPPPIVNKSILRQQSSISVQPIQPPLLPSLRSSLSIFDKFILALLLNDIFVCNFLLPLRLIDLSKGLPFGFLCFLLSFFEKSTTMIELIIINFLLVTSLVYFWKRRLVSRKIWYILIIFSLPIFIGCFLTTLSHVDVDEYGTDNRPPTCKQTFTFIDETTQKILNIFCCFVTYTIVIINFMLIIKIKLAIKVYKKNTLRTIAETAVSRKPPSSSFDQILNEPNRRRSMYYFPSITLEPVTTPSATPPIQNSSKSVDYITYLTIVENSRTLVRSTFIILSIYLIVHIPYWFYELSDNKLSYKLKDLYILSHVFKPIFYMLTNEKYRYHVWGILQCKTFRMLPNRL